MEYLNKIFDNVITNDDLVKIDNKNGYYFADNFLSSFFKLCEIYSKNKYEEKICPLK